VSLRHQIDQIDDDILSILAKRMRISLEIAQYKKEHDMSVLQAGRYDEILTNRTKQGIEMGMSEDFVKTIFEAIHAESVRRQMDVINK
jgi:chorismate mutase